MKVLLKLRENKNKPTVAPTYTHRKQKPNQRWNRQTLIENKNKTTAEPTDIHTLELRPLITPLISFNFSVTKIDSRYVELQLHGMR
jgi:hypothetical protein